MSCTCGFNATEELFAIATGDGRVVVYDVATGLPRPPLADRALGPLGATCLSWALSTGVEHGPRKRRKGRNEKTTAVVNGAGIGIPPERLLAVGTSSGEVILWDVARGSITKRLSGDGAHHNPVCSVAISNAGDAVLSVARHEKLVVIWSLSTGEILGHLSIGKRGARRLCVSPDGSLLATASSTIQLWDLASRQLKKRLGGHATPVSHLCFAPSSGKFLFSAAADRNISMWRCDEGSGTQPRKRSDGVDQGVVGVLRANGIPTSLTVRASSEPDTFGVAAATDAGSVCVWRALCGMPSDEFRGSPTTVVTLDGDNAARSRVFCGSLKEDGAGREAQAMLAAFGRGTAAVRFQHVGLVDSDGLPLSHAILELGGIVASREMDVDTVRGKSVMGRRDLPLPRAMAPVAGAEPMTPGPGVEGLSFEERLRGEVFDKPAAVSSSAVKGGVDKAAGKRLNIESSSSLHIVLTQAIQSNDAHLMEGVLSHHRARIVNETVGNLDPEHALKLLRVLVARLDSKPSVGKHMVVWILAVLSIHTGYLLSLSDFVDTTLGPLARVLESRVEHYDSLCRLSGRLDLVLAQARRSRSAYKPLAMDTSLEPLKFREGTRGVSEDVAATSEEVADVEMDAAVGPTAEDALLADEHAKSESSEEAPGSDGDGVALSDSEGE